MTKPTSPTAGAPNITGYRLDISFPPVGTEPDESQTFECPRCGCRGFHRHQRTVKQVKDQHSATVTSIRYLCKRCGRSVRRYPVGVSARRQSDAVRALSVVLYRLGLSYRNIQQILAAWSCPLGAATIWQNVQSLGAVERTPARRGRVTVEVNGRPDRVVFPSLGPTARLRLLNEEDGAMRLEIRVRDEWRSVWRRIDLPALREVGVRLLGAKPLLSRSGTEAVRAAR